jgi:hypothetical protein
MGLLLASTPVTNTNSQSMIVLEMEFAVGLVMDSTKYTLTMSLLSKAATLDFLSLLFLAMGVKSCQ